MLPLCIATRIPPHRQFNSRFIFRHPFILLPAKLATNTNHKATQTRVWRTPPLQLIPPPFIVCGKRILFAWRQLKNLSSIYYKIKLLYPVLAVASVTWQDPAKVPPGVEAGKVICGMFVGQEVANSIKASGCSLSSQQLPQTKSAGKLTSPKYLTVPLNDRSIILSYPKPTILFILQASKYNISWGRSRLRALDPRFYIKTS